METKVMKLTRQERAVQLIHEVKKRLDSNSIMSTEPHAEIGVRVERLHFIIHFLETKLYMLRYPDRGLIGATLAPRFNSHTDALAFVTKSVDTIRALMKEILDVYDENEGDSIVQIRAAYDRLEALDENSLL
jgi:hypothetical protein